MKRDVGVKGLAVGVMCAVLLLAGSAPGWAADSPFINTGLSFDVTIEASTVTGEYHYKYTASIPESGSREDCFGWYLMGAEYITPGSITHTNLGDYTWYAGEIVQPDASPTHGPAAGVKNTNSSPVVWWIQESVNGGTTQQDIGTFEFDSTKGPMSREWLAHSDGGHYVVGDTIGPSPELSPLLLMLGQGVPILGWIGWKRRRAS